MNNSLGHRGPNGSNFYLGHNLSLGHNRLSIIDLSDSACQPMSYEANGKKVVIVFNGEIYNYIEIKSELCTLGYNFKTESDTEVILASYVEWGEQCVNYFNGMWSFCIFSENENTLFCSRDRLGVKPFYYYYNDGIFIFSSEIKGILKHTNLKINNSKNLDSDAVKLYFALGYIPAPKTIYSNVYKLEAGTSLVFDLEGNSIKSKYKYYYVKYIEKQRNKKQLLEEGASLLKDAVRLRMRSDVPVGAFLSGGLDSSTVVAEMRNFTDLSQLHTFSVGFDEKKFDETTYINIVKDKFKTQHHHYTFTESDFDEILSKYSNIFDEPFSDYSSFPTYSVCSLARDNVTVALSGDGGDEIFGGYPIYNTGYIIENFRRLPVLLRTRLIKILESIEGIYSRIEKINEVLKLSLVDRNEFHAELFSDDRYKPNVFKEWTKNRLGEALDVSNNNLAEALRIYDLKHNTLSDNYLVKVDRASMANSIEVRSPFLDYRFIDFSQKLPVEQKVNFYENKVFMRELIKPLLPNSILNRKKMGFTPPIKTFLQQNLKKDAINNYLEIIRVIDEELYLFYNEILKIKIEKNNIVADLYLVKLIIFSYWYEYWVTGEKI